MLPEGGVRDTAAPYDNSDADEDVWPEDPEPEDEEVVMTRSELAALIAEERSNAIEDVESDLRDEIKNRIIDEI